MYKKLPPTLLLIVFYFLSCNGTKDRIDSAYFNMEGLIAQQIKDLTRLNPYLNKKASINGQVEEQSRKLDSAEWAAELNIFLEADINKPRLIGIYQKEIVEKDSQQIILYKANKPEEVQVEFLRIIYQNNQLKKIESLFTEKNLLYVTRRKIQMNFIDDNQGEPILSDYQINGQQKMILKDTIQYDIVSELVF